MFHVVSDNQALKPPESTSTVEQTKLPVSAFRNLTVGLRPIVG